MRKVHRGWPGSLSAAVLMAVVLMAVVLMAACGSGSQDQAVAAITADADTPAPSPIAVTPSATTKVRPATVGPSTEAASTATPSAMPPSTPAAEQLRTRHEYGSETDQFGWLQLPAASAPAEGFPVVVLVHGGFWRQQFGASLMDDLATDLAERGYASWNIEYRRVGGAGGWPATGNDVAAAIEHLVVIGVDQPVDLDRVVSVGHSAGGHLGLWALGQEVAIQLRGSVGLGAVVDLAYFGPSQALLGGTVDQVPHVYADAAPVLDPELVVLIQGSADSIVPQASLKIAQDALVPIVVVDGDDHFDLIDPTSASWSAAIDAIAMFVGG